jgi:hypothetical protein
MEKITKREMFEAIVEAAKGAEFKFTAEDVITFAENEIALLDKKAVKAKERAATKKAEADELTAVVRQVMSTEDFEPIAEIAARIEGEDVTVAKVTYRLTQLVKSGEAEKQELTIPGGEGVKARKVQGYRLIG